MNKKLVILTIAVLVVHIVVPVGAYPPFVIDPNWEVYTNGDNVVKPGTTVQYRIWGTLHAESQTTAKLVVSIWVYEPTGWAKIYSYYILPEREYSGETPFNETFTVSIPNDAVLNTPVYADLETLTSYWGWLTLSIVQDPIYEQLKDEYNEYRQTHGQSNSEYDYVNSLYNALSEHLDTTRNTSYVLIAIMAVLLFTAVYFAVRKREVEVTAPE